MAMMNFDQEPFFNTYNWLIAEKSFKEVFFIKFYSFDERIGLLWQGYYNAQAHEHFISYSNKNYL
jgi:hypothetical protein